MLLSPDPSSPDRYYAFKDEIPLIVKKGTRIMVENVILAGYDDEEFYRNLWEVTPFHEINEGVPIKKYSVVELLLEGVTISRPCVHKLNLIPVFAMNRDQLTAYFNEAKSNKTGRSP